jgi:hypothetical protein
MSMMCQYAMVEMQQALIIIIYCCVVSSTANTDALPCDCSEPILLLYRYTLQYLIAEMCLQLWHATLSMLLLDTQRVNSMDFVFILVCG